MTITKPARALLVKLLVASALGGLALPLALILLFGLIAGMLMYLYFLFPVMSAITGALAGRQIRSLWFYPLINGVFTIFWVVRACGYDPAVTAQFTGIYIMLGAIAMGLCACIGWLVKQRKS